MKLGNLVRGKLNFITMYYITMMALYIYLISNCIYHYTFGIGIDGCRLELILINLLSIIVYFSSFFELYKYKEKILKSNKRKKKLNNKDCVFYSARISLMFTVYIFLLIIYDMIYIDFYSVFINHNILLIIGFSVFLFLIFFVAIYLLHLNIFINKLKKI